MKKVLGDWSVSLSLDSPCEMDERDQTLNCDYLAFTRKRQILSDIMLTHWKLTLGSVSFTIGHMEKKPFDVFDPLTVPIHKTPSVWWRIFYNAQIAQTGYWSIQDKETNLERTDLFLQIRRSEQEGNTAWFMIVVPFRVGMAWLPKQS